ncbi:hypothetical protein MNBD_GAMMA13-2162 [hydrothermal vent metagenome]|uniref:HipA-like kinase domain-containing protein n=1 Tax=hydrothermal vent metagenome TaxID=652676 RepID=A0A3B0YZ38_9ZZZZ
MLTESGGNPNLFWGPEEERLVVIDHNQAFDSEFPVGEFMKYHIFSGISHDLFGNVLYQQEHRNTFQAVLDQWHNIRNGIPDDWHYLDPEMTVEADIGLDAIFTILNRCTTENLWDHA